MFGVEQESKMFFVVVVEGVVDFWLFVRSLVNLKH